jgi:hypothetical protein
MKPRFDWLDVAFALLLVVVGAATLWFFILCYTRWGNIW